MTTNIVAFSRTFTMWAFTYTHSQLLLRSIKSPTSPYRTLILFKSVETIHLPVYLRGLELQVPHEEGLGKRIFPPDLDYYGVNYGLNGYLALGNGKTRFLMKGDNYEGYIIASAVFWYEDQGEYDQPSPFGNSLPQVRWYSDDNTI